MNLYAFFALLAFFSYLSLGVFVLLVDSKRLLNRIFFFYSLAAAAYSFTEFGYLQAESYETALIWIKARSIWPFTFAFALHFHFLFTRKAAWLRDLRQVGILYLPAFLIFFLDLFTTLVTGLPSLEQGIWGYETPKDSIFPLLTGLYALEYTLIMLGLVLHTAWRNRSRQSFSSKQVYYVLGADIMVILTVIVNTFLQNIPDFHYVNVDSALLLSSNIIIAFTIWKFSLLQVTKNLAHDEIVSSMSEFLILVNPDGRISAVNNLTTEITGFTEDELENHYIGDFFDKEKTPEGFDWFHPQNSGHQKKKGSLITKKGAYVPISFTVLNIPLKGGKDLGWAYMGKVITELEPNKSTSGRKTPTRISNKDSVNQLIKVINHDLSEGTRMIHLCTQLVEYDKIEEKLEEELLFFAEEQTQELILDNLERNRKHLIYIKEEALLLRHKLRALGEYAAADAERKRASVDISKLAKLAFSQIVRYPEKMDVQISIGDLPVIEAVPEQIFRLLKHLMENALKFRKINQSLHIHIDLIFHDIKKAVIEFRDNGIGILPEYHEGVFEIFNRLHHPTQYEGVGIGLAICKKIVDAHKGEIWIKPEHEQGTSICFSLPA